MERKFDDSLSVAFEVTVELSQGHYRLSRTDGVNWGCVAGIESGPKYNGSGTAYGPSVLNTKEQAKAYIDHVANLWNAHAAAQQKEPVADIEALCLALHTAVDYDNARFYLMAEDGDDFVLDGHFTLEELRTIVHTIEKHPLQD